MGLLAGEEKLERKPYKPCHDSFDATEFAKQLQYFALGNVFRNQLISLFEKISEGGGVVREEGEEKDTPL